VKEIKLSQIEVAVDIELPLAVFIRNPPLLMLIVVIPPITNPVGDDFPVDDSSSVPLNTPHCLLNSGRLSVFLWAKHLANPSLLLDNLKKPRFIPSDEILLEWSLLVSL